MLLVIISVLERRIALSKKVVQYHGATFMNSNTKVSNGYTLEKNWINIMRLNDAHKLSLIPMKSTPPKHPIYIPDI